MFSDLTLHIEDLPARHETTAGEITKNRLASAVRALGICCITGPAVFFTVVLLSIYGGLPLFFV